MSWRCASSSFGGVRVCKPVLFYEWRTLYASIVPIPFRLIDLESERRTDRSAPIGLQGSHRSCWKRAPNPSLRLLLNIIIIVQVERTNRWQAFRRKSSERFLAAVLASAGLTYSKIIIQLLSIWAEHWSHYDLFYCHYYHQWSNLQVRLFYCTHLLRWLH